MHRTRRQTIRDLSIGLSAMVALIFTLSAVAWRDADRVQPGDGLTGLKLLVMVSVLAAMLAGYTLWRLVEERRRADQAAETLARALDGAQAAHAAKARFLANVSHEMLTPLNGVAGMADALGRTALDPRQREMVDTIGVSAFALNQVICDLLALAGQEGWAQGAAAPHFEIPPAGVADPPAETAALAQASRGQAPRILIVDDNPTNRRVLELILEQIGAECVSVGDGRQALEAVGQQAFAAILIDIQMPVMDGLTATREIRRMEREIGRAPTPLVVVSANCDPDQVITSQAAGAQRHLAKPVSALSLFQAIEEATEELRAAA